MREPVCYCFEVYEDEIIEIIEKYHAKSVEDLQKYSQACMGCGSCRISIEAIIENHAGKAVAVK